MKTEIIEIGSVYAIADGDKSNKQNREENPAHRERDEHAFLFRLDMRGGEDAGRSPGIKI